MHYNVITMNVVAGLLIGFLNDAWIAKIIAPFIWGLIFIGYIWMVNPEKAKKHAIRHDGMRTKLNMGPKMAFYLIEYATAAATALLFSIIAGAIVQLF